MDCADESYHSTRTGFAIVCASQASHRLQTPGLPHLIGHYCNLLQGSTATAAACSQSRQCQVRPLSAPVSSVLLQSVTKLDLLGLRADLIYHRATPLARPLHQPVLQQPLPPQSHLARLPLAGQPVRPLQLREQAHVAQSLPVDLRS